MGQYFEVVAEADGPSGLERARTYDADLIICDVLMPGMTGFEVTRKLKMILIQVIYLLFIDSYEFCRKSFGRCGKWCGCIYY